MNKAFLKNVTPYANLYRDTKTGIAWIEDGSTGMGHSAHPNINITGSIRGMKSLGYWDKDDKVVRSHDWYYNISKYIVNDHFDKIAAEYCECEECLKRKGENNNG